MVSSDLHLVSAARQNAPAAWETLLKRHQLPLFTYVAELIGDQTAALDIVQETFVSAVRHIATLRDDLKFTAWLFGIAHQKCGQHFRRNQREADLFVSAPEDGAPAREFSDPDEINPRTRLIQREEAAALSAIIARLPAPQRSALLLHVLEDFSLEEIATISAVPLGTIKSRLHHAKRALRQHLQRKP